jgi:hypothetical protein
LHNLGKALISKAQKLGCATRSHQIDAVYFGVAERLEKPGGGLAGDSQLFMFLCQEDEVNEGRN